MISVDTWQVSQIRIYLQDGRLVLDPEYQRKPVWTAKTQMLFIDSLARKIPAGAITIFKDEKDGYAKYEVIDGRQRLTALDEYINGNLIIRENVITTNNEDDDMAEIGGELAKKVCDAGVYADLEVSGRLALDDYKFPIFMVEGTRAEAVRAFVRMNSNLYSLKPAEIRNAVFTGTTFLNETIKLANELSSEMGENSFFVEIGVMTSTAYDRMQDIQFLMECMILVMEGVQHRRDTIDKYCDLYRAPSGQAATELMESIGKTKKAIEQIYELFGGGRMQEHHFPSNGENDFYALLGALIQRGLLSKAQMTKLGSDLISTISEFRRLVTLYMGKVREGEDPGDQYPSSVRDYAGTLLGGQTNSASNRKNRVDVLIGVINDVVDTIENDTFSELQRGMIWAMSVDKICARCQKQVKYPNYHAGHKKARALGGPSLVKNGQIEHATCNLEAGTD